MDDIVKTMQGKLSYGSKQGSGSIGGGSGGGYLQKNNHKIFSELFLNILLLGSICHWILLVLVGVSIRNDEYLNKISCLSIQLLLRHFH